MGDERDRLLLSLKEAQWKLRQLEREVQTSKDDRDAAFLLLQVGIYQHNNICRNRCPSTRSCSPLAHGQDLEHARQELQQAGEAPDHRQALQRSGEEIAALQQREAALQAQVTALQITMADGEAERLRLKTQLQKREQVLKTCMYTYKLMLIMPFGRGRLAPLETLTWVIMALICCGPCRPPAKYSNSYNSMLASQPLLSQRQQQL